MRSFGALIAVLLILAGLALRSVHGESGPYGGRFETGGTGAILIAVGVLLGAGVLWRDVVGRLSRRIQAVAALALVGGMIGVVIAIWPKPPADPYLADAKELETLQRECVPVPEPLASALFEGILPSPKNASGSPVLAMGNFVAVRNDTVDEEEYIIYGTLLVEMPPNLPPSEQEVVFLKLGPLDEPMGIHHMGSSSQITSFPAAIDAVPIEQFYNLQRRAWLCSYNNVNTSPGLRPIGS